MRNKHGYIHIGGQLGRKLTASEVLGQAYGAPRIAGAFKSSSFASSVVAQSLAAQLSAEATRQDLRAQGWEEGIHDEMIAPGSWTDSQLAALVSDMRRHETESVSQFAHLDFKELETRCVLDEVQQAMNTSPSDDLRQRALNHAMRTVETLREQGLDVVGRNTHQVDGVISMSPRVVPMSEGYGNTHAQPIPPSNRPFWGMGSCHASQTLTRQHAQIEDIVQGDKVFMTGDSESRTVLNVHESSHFISLVIAGWNDNIPFIIHRHRGAVIYKEARSV